MIKSYPLHWPDGWARTRNGLHKNGKFSKGGEWVSVNEGIKRILESLQKMGIDKDDVIISTNIPTRLDGLPRSNQPEPTDKGVSVYWRKNDKSPMNCMAIDIYTAVADNLAAVAATLEAIRAIERHGGQQVQERTFRGFAALPEKASSPWREILFDKGDEPEIVTPEVIEAAFRIEARKHHPDTGGSRAKFEAVVEARKQALQELGGTS